MLRKPKNKQKTLAEKVTETILHPNESGGESEFEDVETAARVVDYNEDEYELPDAGTTEFRKRNVKLLSEQSSKYKGKIAARKDFEQDSIDEDQEDSLEDDSDVAEDYENSTSSEDDEALKAFSNELKTKQDDNENNGIDSVDDDEDIGSDINEDGEDDNDDEDVDDDESDSDDDETEDTEVMSKVNHEAEIQKGFCVQNQLRIWERLLELRINSQKILTKINQLPSSQDLKDMEKQNSQFKDVKEETTKSTSNLLQNLLLLKDTLSTQFSELNKAIKPSLKRPSPFIGQAGEPPLKQIGFHLQERFQDFRSYRNTVLLKWDDRTKLLQPGAGVRHKTMNEEYDIIKKIDNALMNKTLMIQKSQHLKSSQQHLDKDAVKGLANNKEENDLNCNVYDDSDFYHQQLRELIEYKANTSSNMSEVTKQFMELQKLRQKMKKKVDTRASKGRKLRYNVHNKLINFMAPHDNSNWTNESIDELSKSLFV